MSLFDENTTEAWRQYFERELAETHALIKLRELRYDLNEDVGLFLVKEIEIPDAKTGDRFIASGKEYEVVHNEFGHLFVRELCQT